MVVATLRDVRVSKSRGKGKSEARRSERLGKTLVQLGATIARLRKERELTQEALAAKAKIDPKHIQDVESGKTNVTVATLLGIARGLGVSIGELFSSS